MEAVVAVTGPDTVVARARPDRIIPTTRLDTVVAVPAIDQIGTITPFDLVIATAPVQSIRIFRPHDRHIFITRIGDVIRGRNRRIAGKIVQQIAVRDRPRILGRGILGVISFIART